MSAAGAARAGGTAAVAPPRWFWWLPLLALTAWWPIAPYWQSDDYIALHYAHDLSRVLHDFHGPQYGATDTWLFYRPLITLSFWLDQQLGGAAAGLSHASNVLAHAVSALFVGLLWRRFLGDGQAFAAGLLWAVMPSHLGSIAWAVGRVDSHTTVWCLSTLWLCLGAVHGGANERGANQGRRRVAIAVTTALALMSKELALVVPALATALVLAATSNLAGRARLRHACSVTAPAWCVLAVYLPFRVWVLGRFGGYDAAQYDAAAMLQGAVAVPAYLLVPLPWAASPPAGPKWLWLTAAATPVVLAVLLAIRRRGVAFAGGAGAMFLLAATPMAAVFAATDNPQTLRNYYLPAVALTGLLAAGGRFTTLAVLTAWAWPFVAARSEQHAADRESASMHAAILTSAESGAASPLFVAGLPHASRNGLAVQLHFGLDRLLEPPFGSGRGRLFALRPLAELPGVVRLAAVGTPPWPLPVGSTWYFNASCALVHAPASPPLPVLPIAGDDAGALDFTTERLQKLEQRELEFGLTTPGVRTQAFRLTLFTANGYLACLLPNHAAPAAAEGRLDARTLLAGDDRRQPNSGPACYAVDGSHFLAEALPVPTTIDLSPAFPVLLEGGVMHGTEFRPTHRADRLLTFRFDRDYPAWVRRVQGRE